MKDKTPINNGKTQEFSSLAGENLFYAKIRAISSHLYIQVYHSKKRELVSNVLTGFEKHNIINQTPLSYPKGHDSDYWKISCFDRHCFIMDVTEFGFDKNNSWWWSTNRKPEKDTFYVNILRRLIEFLLFSQHTSTSNINIKPSDQLEILVEVYNLLTNDENYGVKLYESTTFGKLTTDLKRRLGVLLRANSNSIEQARELIFHFFTCLLVLQNELIGNLELAQLFDRMVTAVTNENEKKKKTNKDHSLILDCVLEFVHEISGNCILQLLKRFELAFEYIQLTNLTCCMMWYNILHAVWSRYRNKRLEKHDVQRVTQYSQQSIDKMSKNCAKYCERKHVEIMINDLTTEIGLWKGSEAGDIERVMPLEDRICKLIRGNGYSNETKLQHIETLIALVPPGTPLRRFLDKVQSDINEILEDWKDWHAYLIAVKQHSLAKDEMKMELGDENEALKVVMHEYALALNERPRINKDEILKFISRHEELVSLEIRMAMIKNKYLLRDARFMPFFEAYLKENDLNPDWRDDLARCCRQFMVDNNLAELFSCFLKFDLDQTVLQQTLLDGGNTLRVAELDFAVAKDILMMNGINKRLGGKVAEIMNFEFTNSDDISTMKDFCVNLVNMGQLLACEAILDAANKKYPILGGIVRNDTKETINMLSSRKSLAYLELSRINRFFFFSLVFLLCWEWSGFRFWLFVNFLGNVFFFVQHVGQHLLYEWHM